MSRNNRNARIAGLLYIAMGVTGVFSMLFVYSQIVVPGDGAATAANIAASESLFRIGALSNIVSQVLFLFLAVSLYKLLSHVQRDHARLMIVLVVASVPISLIGMASQLAALAVAGGTDFGATLGSGQLQAFVMVLIELYERCVGIAEIFWGLWLFPLGYLVLRSGLLPRVFGIALMAACFGYLVSSAVSLLAPGAASPVPVIASSVSALAELAFMFRLAIFGIREETPKPSVAV